MRASRKAITVTLPLLSAVILASFCGIQTATASELAVQRSLDGISAGGSTVVHQQDGTGSSVTEGRAVYSPAYVSYRVEVINHTGKPLAVREAWASDSFDTQAPHIGDTVGPGATYTYDVTWWFARNNVSKVVFEVSGGGALVCEAYYLSANGAVVYPDGSYAPVAPEWRSSDSTWVFELRE
ncbi:hypothetical protein [Streptomyces sp. NPDC008121]|uniref:hypothetical protein n=1 Tax=Streptomyces sp. NPDC008121 TaxID=3364809 RepID=UPI0036E9B94F